MDTCYDVKDLFVQDAICALVEAGHKIGIHPSYRSFRSKHRIKKEIETLRTILTSLNLIEVLYTSRQHYLVWDQSVTPILLAENGIKIDRSVGYSDDIGFRASTCYEYELFDAKNHKATGVIEHPITIMDVGLFAVFSCKSEVHPEAFELASRIRKTTKDSMAALVYCGITIQIQHPSAKKLYQQLIASKRESEMLKIALVGCAAGSHTATLVIKGLAEKANLVAVCDLDKERATNFSKKYSTAAFVDMHMMIRESKPDIVVVLTESGSHSSHVLDLADHGKHIIVEKPMALRLEDANSMIEACSRKNIHLFVVKQNRFNLPITKLKEAVQKNRFGKLVLGTVRVRWSRDQNYYDLASWRGTWLMDGGVLANQAIHHIDMLIWLMGKPKSVFAYTSVALVNTETEDTAVVVLRFNNGAPLV